MIDRSDFASVTQLAQGGGQPSFWPIIINTTGLALQTELEININPCDAIWIPTVYDLSIQQSPGQPPPNLPPGWVPPPYQPDTILINGVEMAVVGANLADVYQDGVLIQSAPVFSIRINSPNNPWLLFGLSTQIGTTWSSANPPNLVAGQGGCMRSLTGPIARLWVKFYRFGTWQSPTLPPRVRAGTEASGMSAIVLMSSLGYQQMTIEQVRTWDQSATNVFTPSGWSQAISSGGYVTPQLNSADRISAGMLA